MKVETVAADLSSRSGVSALLDHVGDRPIEVLVNNARFGSYGPFAEADLDREADEVAVDVTAVVALARAFLPGMRQRGWGRILISSSSGVVQPIPNLGISNSLRAGLLAWAKTLSAEVAKDGVTVNTMLPGRIETDRLNQIDAANAERTGQSVAQVKAASLTGIPAGRLGTPSEYGAIAAFLLSDQAGYITGATIRVDGGMIRAT